MRAQQTSARRSWQALALASLLLGACDAPEADDDAGSSSSGMSGAPDCEDGPVVTYDTFGRGFLAGYCNGCHGGAVVDRRGAPAQVVLDDREIVSMYADRIFARVVPEDGSAPTMPPAGGVTPEDRERVIVWLTCWP